MSRLSWKRLLRIIHRAVKWMRRPRIIHRVVKWDGFWWVVGIAAELTTGIFLSWVFWEDLHGDQDSPSTTFRNLGFVIGGIIAITLAVWRSIVATHQAATAQQGLLNERYQKGAEMLGSNVLSVRLGGIYALERLASKYPEQYHIQIMKLFCAFARFPTKDQSLESGQVEIKPGTLLGIRQDVEAVIHAIGSRAESGIALERKASFRLDLRGVDLPKAQFLDANLSNAMFHDSNLSGTNFANTDLSDAFFTSADLSGATLRSMNFTRTRLSFVNLSGAMLEDEDLSGLDFHDANLSCANLHRANLSGAIFQNAIVANAWLECADLSGAGFLRANLSGARFMKADLSEAHFLDANLSKADISGANISGAKFSDGGPQTAKGLTQAQLDEARADPNNPPKLTGVLDAETRKPLVWRGKPLNDGS